MHCVDCDASIRVRHNQTVAYDFGGLPDVSLCGIDVRVCDNGHREYMLPKRDELHRALTHALVVKPTRLMPCEVRFMRQHLGWSQTVFARRMGVAPESASRWESGAIMMAPTAERLLAPDGAHAEARSPTTSFSTCSRGSTTSARPGGCARCSSTTRGR